MGYVILIFIIIISAIVYANYVANDNTKNIKDKFNKLNNEFDKVVALGYERNDGILNYIGFDNTNKIMVIKTKNQKEQNIKYNEIISAELIENGESVLNIGSIIGGSVIAGGTGAIIGAINKKNKIISRGIKLNLDSFDNTSYWINLLDNGVYVGFIPDIVSGESKIIDTINYILRNK